MEQKEGKCSLCIRTDILYKHPFLPGKTCFMCNDLSKAGELSWRSLGGHWMCSIRRKWFRDERYPKVHFKFMEKEQMECVYLEHLLSTLRWQIKLGLKKLPNWDHP